MINLNVQEKRLIEELFVLFMEGIELEDYNKKTVKSLAKELYNIQVIVSKLKLRVRIWEEAGSWLDVIKEEF